MQLMVGITLGVVINVWLIWRLAVVLRERRGRVAGSRHDEIRRAIKSGRAK